MSTRRKRTALGLGLVAVVTLAVAASLTLGAGGVGANSKTVLALPRASTLYTTGTMWGPYSDLNPFKTWDYVTGTVGLVYEPLFNYDPLSDKFTPWLATKGVWTASNV